MALGIIGHWVFCHVPNEPNGPLYMLGALFRNVVGLTMGEPQEPLKNLESIVVLVSSFIAMDRQKS